MLGMNSRVTEHAVYWPRKCSQAAGQSAWLVHPCVINSPLANESPPLFVLSIEASHHQRRPVYLPLQSATHTTSPSFSLPLRRSIHPFWSVSQTTLCLPCLHRKPNRTNLNQLYTNVEMKKKYLFEFRGWILLYRLKGRIMQNSKQNIVENLTLYSEGIKGKIFDLPGKHLFGEPELHSPLPVDFLHPLRPMCHFSESSDWKMGGLQIHPQTHKTKTLCNLEHALLNQKAKIITFIL